MLRRASTKIAHNSTIPVLGTSQDLKPLQNLIIAEKAVLVSLKKLSVDYFKASDALRTWGLSEGNDLGDILSASSSLLKVFSAALVEYASHGDFMRKQLKVIRTKEESLDNLKRCRRSARRKAKSVDKKLSKMGSDSRNLATQKESLSHLQEEVRKMDSGIMFEEAALSNLKKSTTKAWLGLKFGGLVQCCQKGTIAGEFGKLAIAEISSETTRPGMPHRISLSTDHSKVEGLVKEADQCINSVALFVNPSAGFRDKANQHRRASPPASSNLSPPTTTSRKMSSEPQQQPPPTPTLHDSNESSAQATHGCAVHRHNTSIGPAPSPVKTPLPSSSKSKGLRDPLSSGGRRPIGDDSSMAGTSHLTTNRHNGSSGGPRGDAVYNDPPPSFDDALRAHTYVPVVGSRSEASLANIAGHGHVPVRSATVPRNTSGNEKRKRTQNNNNTN